ncbi:MAG: TRAP transporter large permease subunit [Candidatus Marinimicrobia bacterium]|nr:TRAP transporter large permease subunit [Candidatus Neomarinimicrobiota bacterium]MBT3828584.1 TRAP transporter large permease subunit [Candidatus Neomarinimicrobiota bacterium]MBT3996954.1 TRAP transporter large permease subunit [Candidatus Neomarinimicrobiota bacterium]MBT5338999.1 TRAP transporter large permease subunit [Candidatus Neomarinimicrobiota bacterium]MBT6000725.1 TRAP transporter large permease subunit [Candidatus Neomarinimicrobiota bacterium]
MAEIKEKDRFVDRLKWGEDTLALVVFTVMVFLPAFETITRLFGRPGVPASAVIVQHLTLWIGFIGAVLAARQNKLLALTTHPLFVPDEAFHFGRWVAKNISLLVVVTLAWGSWQLLRIEYQYPMDIAPNISRWVAQLVMPIGFSLIALQIYFSSSNDRLLRASMALVMVIFSMIALTDTFQDVSWIAWLGSAILLISLIYGAPIFVGLGGIAILFFWKEYIPASAIPTEAYRIVVSPTLATIPLFTLAGYILAESGASKRMVKLFRVLFGWIPGGTPVVIVILCGFFTALTGGSGVTILALGGILYPLMLGEGYSRSFSLGLITVAGSLGLLFPPSLPAIIYGVTANVSVKDIFIGGLVPGTVLVLMVAGFAVWQGRRKKKEYDKLNILEILKVLWETKWEIIIPVIILAGVFGGFTTLVETASLTVVYIFFIEVFVYKDLKINDLPKIVIDCAILIGGVLIILGVAMGLTSYFVDAEIPTQLLHWVEASIQSKYVFLLMLNIVLLGVGCMMDIFSAIIVIVPLISQIGAHFGIHPVHLAIIFIANMELGFLTPPVGMNLFLSAYRFGEDMPTVYKATLPFFLIRLLAVLAITYIPFLTLGLLK